MYTALDIANHVISRCASLGHPVSYYRLQELLYFIRKEFLSVDKDIFTEPVEAAPSGPVVRSVHNRYCAFAARGILLSFNSSISEDDAVIIDSVTERYRALPPWDMANLIKKTGGAWDTVYDNGKGKYRAIPPSLIADD